MKERSDSSSNVNPEDIVELENGRVEVEEEQSLSLVQSESAESKEVKRSPITKKTYNRRVNFSQS
jgi:hypothetical protein